MTDWFDKTNPPNSILKMRSSCGPRASHTLLHLNRLDSKDEDVKSKIKRRKRLQFRSSGVQLLIEDQAVPSGLKMGTRTSASSINSISDDCGSITHRHPAFIYNETKPVQSELWIQPRMKRRQSRGFWDEVENQKKFMEGLFVKLKMSDHQRWSSITTKTIRENGGSSILARYAGSASKLIRSVFPKHCWDQQTWRKRTSKGFWDEISNQKRFMEKLFAKLGMEDDTQQWRTITVRNIRENGGRSIAERYRCRGIDYLLHHLFPDRIPRGEFQKSYDRLENEIKRNPKKFYSNPSNWKRVIQFLELKLRIKKPEEWYRVSQKQIAQLLPISDSERYQELVSKLIEFYPLYEWEEERFYLQSQKMASQRMLRIQVEELFPQSGKNL